MKTSAILNRTQALRQQVSALFPCVERTMCFLAGLVFACSTFPASAQLSKKVELYHWVDFSIEAPKAAAGVDKWDVEGSCVWTHENGAIRRTSLLWYSGSGDTYVYRFGGSLRGRWTGVTSSPAAALDELELTVEVTPSSNPRRIGWSGRLSGKPTAWAHQKGPDGKLVKCTPILIMMPGVRHWFDDPARMRTFVGEFNDNHGFNGGHIPTVGLDWFEVGSTGSLRTVAASPDERTFDAIEAAASEWSERGGWHHWIGHRYSDSDIGQGRDPDPANKGKYLSRGIAWNTLRSGREQYAGWEHWSTTTSDSAIDTGLAMVPDRPMMSEDRFRRRENAWRQKDMHSDDDILKEIPRWAQRGVAAIYGRLIDTSNDGSDIWPNRAAVKAVIEGIEE